MTTEKPLRPDPEAADTSVVHDAADSAPASPPGECAPLAAIIVAVLGIVYVPTLVGSTLWGFALAALLAAAGYAVGRWLDVRARQNT